MAQCNGYLVLPRANAGNAWKRPRFWFHINLGPTVDKHSFHVYITRVNITFTIGFWPIFVSPAFQIISIFVTNWSKMGRRGTGVAVFIGQGICGFICLPLLIYGKLTRATYFWLMSHCGDLYTICADSQSTLLVSASIYHFTVHEYSEILWVGHVFRKD